MNNSSISISISSSSTTTLLTKQTSIARQAALREWEIATAFGTRPTNATMGQQPPMLEGRLFFSANSSYPISVFSIIRYEPRTSTNRIYKYPSHWPRRSLSVLVRVRGAIHSSYTFVVVVVVSISGSLYSFFTKCTGKEEAAFRRRKLEAIGGGGSQFVLPNRDWRGIS